MVQKGSLWNYPAILKWWSSGRPPDREPPGGDFFPQDGNIKVERSTMAGSLSRKRSSFAQFWLSDRGAPFSDLFAAHITASQSLNDQQLSSLSRASDLDVPCWYHGFKLPYERLAATRLGNATSMNFCQLVHHSQSGLKRMDATCNKVYPCATNMINQDRLAIRPSVLVSLQSFTLRVYPLVIKHSHGNWPFPTDKPSRNGGLPDRKSCFSTFSSLPDVQTANRPSSTLATIVENNQPPWSTTIKNHYVIIMIDHC